MSGSSFGRQTLMYGGITIVFVSVVTGNYLLLMLMVTIALGVLTYMSMSGRIGTDRPNAAQLVQPISEPANLEGRVDRMTVDDEEVASTSWKPWEQTVVVPVYSITISGLRYRLDPVPVRRGNYDWVNEGSWVTATFDRGTRIVYDLRVGTDPTASA